MTPYEMNEIVRRVVAELRTVPYSSMPGLVAYATHGPLALNYTERLAYLDAQELKLQNREFAVLAALVRNINTVLPRERLLEMCWPHPEAIESPYVVNTAICKLRRKLGPHRTLIKTVVNVGFRFTLAK